MINETVQIVADPINWSMWSVICAITTIVFAVIGFVIRLTRNHTKLAEGHKHLEKTTEDKFKVVHHRLDGKADDKIVGSIDAKLDIIIEKLM
ncbi:hypothetical protein [Marinifilum flexuosum]|uniref:Uncharacterized protein n=1 Tax=Marinifilum flexuosum TaxID=1117708 RepID=A0A419WN04_9BACT|nr:hypothetical protein [Marinifilum flexuosum]RKD96776.1 hypothetical protein BXY64_3723 [Marinifilum flexuosum]